jgi:transketolase
MSISDNKIKKLKRIAKCVRKDLLKAIYEGKMGHPGGSLSATDILVSLYFSKLRIFPENPNQKNRDIFILSKGHAASALYAVLAKRGFFSKDLLKTFGKINSSLQVHPDMTKVPGVEISTGALGMGLSVGVGMALASRMDGSKSRVYVLIGDGEMQSGQVWEASICASHYKLDNLVAILDYNKIQLLGPVSQIMGIEPVAEKWRARGWKVIEIDGHKMREINEALKKAEEIKGKPSMIIAHTTKGKGISFMENTAKWHGGSPTEEELKRALEELKD